MKRAPFSRRLKNAWRALTARYYDAADKGRLYGNFNRAQVNEPPNTALVTEAPEIIARIRLLKRNNPLVKGSIGSIVNAIWPSPPRFEPMVHFLPRNGDPGNPVDVTNNAMEREWNKWAKGACDFDGWASHRQHFDDILHMMTTTLLVCGECFIVRRRRRGDGSRVRLQLQILEPDRLAYGLAGRGGLYTDRRPGIVYDDNGRPTAYQFLRDINAVTSDFEEIPAADVCHLMLPDRPQMQIGDLSLACVLNSVSDIGEYIRNELLVKAMMTRVAGIVTGDMDAYTVPGTGGGTNENDRYRKMDLNPMTLWEMPEGEFKELDLNRPGANFDMFTAVTLKFVAVGLGVPYSLISADYREASYSAERMAALQTLPNVMRWRRLIDTNGLCRIAEWFEEAAYQELGLIPLVPGTDTETLYSMKVHLPGTRYIDPLKELRAEAMEIAMGLASPQEVAARHGGDYYKAVESIAEAVSFAESLGFEYYMHGDKPVIRPKGQAVEVAPPRVNTVDAKADLPLYNGRSHTNGAKK